MPPPVRRPKAPAATMQLRVTVKNYPSMNANDITKFLRARKMGDPVLREIKNGGEKPYWILCAPFVEVAVDQLALFMDSLSKLQQEQSCTCFIEVQ